jgi:hypothetical protein
MANCSHHRCLIRRKMSGRTGTAPDISPETLKETASRFYLSTGENLLEASGNQPLALVFLRHFGCTFTRQILRGLEELKRAADARGARLVLVHMLRDGAELRYLPATDNVARLADPRCELYRAFGLGKGGILELFGPKVWWLGFLAIYKGCGVGHLAGDGRQMPGAFLFHRGQVVAAQRARSASDLPDLPALIPTTAVS